MVSIGVLECILILIAEVIYFIIFPPYWYHIENKVLETSLYVI